MIIKLGKITIDGKWQWLLNIFFYLNDFFNRPLKFVLTETIVLTGQWNVDIYNTDKNSTRYQFEDMVYKSSLKKSFTHHGLDNTF